MPHALKFPRVLCVARGHLPAAATGIGLGFLALARGRANKLLFYTMLSYAL